MNKIPKEFWVEGVGYIIYLSNRCSQEAWSIRKPIVSHFKVFGSIDYVHVDDQGRTKLYDKSRNKMIFMCYDQKFKGYKFYNLNKENMVISRDVKFKEGAWDWKVNDDEKYELLLVLDEEQKIKIIKNL